MFKLFLISTFVLIFGAGRLFSQQLISIDSFRYKVNGVAFPSEQEIPIITKNFSGRFTPDLSDITEGETLIIKNYNQFMLSDSELNDVKTVDVQRNFRKYRRQYVGFINLNNERLLLIQFLKGRNDREFNNEYENWKIEYIIGFGEFYEKNTFQILVNLTNKSISYY